MESIREGLLGQKISSILHGKIITVIFLELLTLLSGKDLGAVE